MSSINSKGFVRLLQLMTEDEKLCFKADYKLAENANNDEILVAIEELPKYEALRAFIRAGNQTLVLLREVFVILESLGIATRTTGCVFVLANPTKPEERTELVFSQQTVGMVCSWPIRKKWNRVHDSLSDLQSTWKGFRLAWDKLVKSAEPTCRPRRFDVRSFARGQVKYKPVTYSIDKDAQQVLGHFWDQVEQMSNRLNEIQENEKPEEVKWILHNVQELRPTVLRSLNDPRNQFGATQRWLQEKPDKRMIDRHAPQGFVADFDKFLEDVYTLADLIRGEGIADMLQVDIWSSRPQLFEVWVLLKLLSWLRNRGYTIKLLKTENVGKQSPFRWNLSYSKDSSPCAEVSNIESGVNQYLFYQLYRTSGDMPDISLLESPDSSSSPIWSVDPKHSEKEAYSLADYKNTAIRYRDSFGAKLSLVVEYFDRPKLGDANPIEFVPHAKLIRGCRFDGSGWPILLKELSVFHPVRSQVLVCIDFSESFSLQRDNVLDGLRQRCRSGHLTNVASECICFAGSTTIVENFDNWSKAENGSYIEPKGLTGGTASAPLVKAISDMKERMVISKILIVTDGGFDVQAERLINQIQDELGIEVTLVTQFLG